MLPTHYNTHHHPNDTTDSGIQRSRERVSITSGNRVINDLDDGADCPSAGLQTTQSWEEWLIHQRVMLPSRGTLTVWRNGLTETSHQVQQEEEQDPSNPPSSPSLSWAGLRKKLFLLLFLQCSLSGSSQSVSRHP